MFIGSWSIDESLLSSDSSVMFVIRAIDMLHWVQIALFIRKGIAYVYWLIMD